MKRQKQRGRRGISKKLAPAPFDMKKMAEAAKAKLPHTQKKLSEVLAQVNPHELLAQLSASLLHPANEFPDVEELARRQVRVELIAWMVLARPMPDVPEQVIDARILGPLDKLLDDYFNTYAVSLMPALAATDGQQVEDQLRFTLQLEALYVRGEGQPQQIESLALGLYGPHEQWFRNNLGFTIEDAFRFSGAIFGLVADKFNERKRIARAKNDEALAAYERLLSAAPSSLSPSERSSAANVRKVGAAKAAALFGGYNMFYRLRDAMGFTQVELARALKEEHPSESLLRFLSRMSQEIGSVTDAPDPLGLNPLAKRPLIRDGDVYYLPVPPVLQDALLNTFHFDLWEDEGYRQQYDDARSQWLESEALRPFRTLFPGGEAYLSLSYGPKKGRTELDGLVRYDDKLILIECKWKTLTMAARQGSVEAASIDIKKSIVAAYEQGARARDFIRAASGPVEFTSADGTVVTVNPAEITEIFIVSLLGRGAMSVLASNLPSLVPAGMFSRGEYPWALSLSDLSVVCGLMEFPSQIFDYIKRRDALMRDPRFRGHDEWDLLGLYFAGRLDPDHAEFEGAHLVTFSGVDTDIDRFLRSRVGEGLPPTGQPRRSLPDAIRKLLHLVEASGLQGRSDVVSELLGFSDDALAELDNQVAATRSKTEGDGLRHSFSCLPEGGVRGLTFVCTSGDIEGLKGTLESLCKVRKYATTRHCLARHRYRHLLAGASPYGVVYARGMAGG